MLVFNIKEIQMSQISRKNNTKLTSIVLYINRDRMSHVFLLSVDYRQLICISCQMEGLPHRLLSYITLFIWDSLEV